MEKRAFIKLAVLFLVLVLILSFFLSGCSRQNNEIRDLKEKNRTLEKRVRELKEQLKDREKRTITLYFVKTTPKNFWLVPELREITYCSDVLKIALEELIKGSASKSLTGLIPEETKVLDVKVKNWIAYPNFSKEIYNINVGSAGEALVLASIANTLIKFPGVEKVRILVEGEEIETLAGHVDLTEPLGRNEHVLFLDSASDSEK